MAITTQERKEALAAAAEQELKGLEARGVRMAGNAFSPVVLVKGELNDAERSGEPLLSGADGTALRAALSVGNRKIFACWLRLPAQATRSWRVA